MRSTSLAHTFKPAVWHLVIYCLLVYGVSLFFPRDLWVQDEMRYGEVVREMLAYQQWLIPHLNGYPYPDKPPVYFILVSGLSLLIGNIDDSFHLITLFSTALAAMGTYLFAKHLFDERTAYWATLIFSSSLLSLIVGHIVRMDMLLTASVVFSWYFLLRYHQTHVPRWIRWFWFACAAGIAIKGPIALLFSLLPAIIWFYYLAGWQKVIQMHLLKGFFLIIGLLSLWIGLVLMQGHGDYLATIWHEQIVGRTVNSWSHREPVYFYLVLLPMLLLPWSSLTIAGIKHLWTQPDKTRTASLIACIVPLVAISLVSGKLFIYLQPLFPAASIITASALQKHSLNAKTPLWLSIMPMLLYALFAVLCHCLKRPDLFKQSDMLNHGFLEAIGLSLGILITLHLVTIKKPLLIWLKTTLFSNFIFSVLIFGIGSSVLNPLFSGKTAAATILNSTRPDTPIGIVNSTRGILNFYVGKQFTELTVAESANWFTNHQTATLIVPVKTLAQALPAMNITTACRSQQTFTVELKQYYVIRDCYQR